MWSATRSGRCWTAAQLMHEHPEGGTLYTGRKADPEPHGPGDHAQVLNFEWAHREEALKRRVYSGLSALRRLLRAFLLQRAQVPCG